MYRIICPMLFVQGARDPHCRIDKLEELLRRVGAPTRLHVIADCGPGLEPIKKTGRTAGADPRRGARAARDVRSGGHRARAELRFPAWHSPANRRRVACSAACSSASDGWFRALEGVLRFDAAHLPRDRGRPARDPAGARGGGRDRRRSRGSARAGWCSMFLGLGAVIVLWMAVTGLIWAVGLATHRRQRPTSRGCCAAPASRTSGSRCCSSGASRSSGALCAWGARAALAGVARDRHARGARDRHDARARDLRDRARRAARWSCWGSAPRPARIEFGASPTPGVTRPRRPTPSTSSRRRKSSASARRGRRCAGRREDAGRRTLRSGWLSRSNMTV